jgi:hypothetical protein
MIGFKFIGQIWEYLRVPGGNLDVAVQCSPLNWITDNTISRVL